MQILRELPKELPYGGICMWCLFNVHAGIIVLTIPKQKHKGSTSLPLNVEKRIFDGSNIMCFVSQMVLSLILNILLVLLFKLYCWFITRLSPKKSSELQFIRLFQLYIPEQLTHSTSRPVFPFGNWYSLTSSYTSWSKPNLLWKKKTFVS